MANYTELIKARRSVRTYDVKEVSPEDLEKLRSFMENVPNPYGIPVKFKLLDPKARELKCPVAAGASLFVGGKVSREQHAEEAFGYSFERLVLYAQSLGLGTVWVGGTMDRDAFERAMELGPGERMPCMSPIGYPAKKMSVKESVMRKAVKADARAPFTSLFFDGGFAVPLSPEKAGVLSRPLEMVRWAPSAVNKQPWRVVAAGNKVHFYLKHSKGFVSEKVGDMQKIDMGIALCHFALAAESDGLDVRFETADPGIPAEADTEYIASFALT